MTVYKIQFTVPKIYTAYVEAPNADEAWAKLVSDEFDIDYMNVSEATVYNSCIDNSKATKVSIKPMSKQRRF